jgi:YD repeat-containing protein
MKAHRDLNFRGTGWQRRNLQRHQRSHTRRWKAALYRAGQTYAVDRRERVTVYGYDERDQLRTETWYANVADANAQVNSTGGIGYAYDVVGRMTAAGTTSLGYDSLDRITTQSFGHIPGFASLTTTYGNRQDGLRDTLSLTIGGVPDFINQYDYDERLWLKNVTQTALQTTGGNAVATKQVVFQHGNDGRLEHLLRYADLAATQFVAQTDFAYDGGNRLKGISHFKPATGGNVGLAQHTWSYDGADRIEHLTSPDGNVTYAYDNRGQLIGADYTGASQPADAVYGYDHNGNRTDAGFDIDEHNLAESDGTYSYLYDAEGNRTHRTKVATGEVDVYTWDNRNRLTAVTHFTSTGAEVWDVEYQYDYANRLIVRIETLAGLPSTIQRFVYDGNQMVLETNGAGQVTHRYL